MGSPTELITHGLASGRRERRFDLDAWADDLPFQYAVDNARRHVFILRILAVDCDGNLLIALDRFGFEIQAIEKNLQCLSVVR